MGTNGSTPQVTFETSFFQIRPGEDAATNPGRYGEALAKWMQQQLQARSVDVEEVVAEDFGWALILSRKPFLLWLACGNVDGSKTEWSLFPVAEPPMICRRFGRKRIREATHALWHQVNAIVPDIPGVTNICWE